MRGLNWCQVGHPNSLKNLSLKNKTLLFRKSPHLFCLKFWSLLGSGGGWRQCRQGQLKFLNSRWGWTSVVCAVLKWTSLHFFSPIQGAEAECLSLHGDLQGWPHPLHVPPGPPEQLLCAWGAPEGEERRGVRRGRNRYTLPLWLTHALLGSLLNKRYSSYQSIFVMPLFYLLQ